jgi:hypothetical protein
MHGDRLSARSVRGSEDAARIIDEFIPPLNLIPQGPFFHEDQNEKQHNMMYSVQIIPVK